MYSLCVMFSLPPAFPIPACQILLIVALIPVKWRPRRSPGRCVQLLEIQVHTVKNLPSLERQGQSGPSRDQHADHAQEKIPGRQWLHPDEHHRT